MLSRRGVGRVDDGLQIVRQALCADIADDEAVGESVLLEQRLRPRPGRELHRVDAVRHDADLRARHAALDQALAQAAIGRDDPRGGAIEHVLDRAQHSHHQMALAHHVEGDDRIGPQVADLEQIGPPLGQREQAARQARQKLRRSRHDHVGFLQQAGKEAGQAETREIERPAQDGAVRREIGPHPHDLDSVHRFPLEEPILVGGQHFAAGKIGDGCHNRNLRPGVNPPLTMLKSPDSRRVALRREVVSYNKDMHESRAEGLVNMQAPGPPIAGAKKTKRANYIKTLRRGSLRDLSGHETLRIVNSRGGQTLPGCRVGRMDRPGISFQG